MQEIIYSETAAGVFEPIPIKAQKRKAATDSRKTRAKRDELIAAIVVGALLILGAAAYVLSVLVAFGGWWVR